jgi:hypothetical protein
MGIDLVISFEMISVLICNVVDTPLTSFRCIFAQIFYIF